MTVDFMQGDARKLPLNDASVDMTIGSPPYLKARKYGRDDVARDVEPWVEFMLGATREALRVSKGLTLWVCAGQYRNNTYQPGPECLVAAAHKAGIELCRPLIWTKNGLPGGPAFMPRNCWEYVLAFKNPGVPYADLLAMGTPPKHPRGGRMRNRGADDRRCDRPYPLPKLAKPGDLVHATVGGGHMGHKLAHRNEAPFPEKLVEFFIRCFCPPGGTVLDPFCGSGTTLAVARKLGRNGIGIDLRDDQVELARRRAADVRYDPPVATEADDPLPAPPEESGGLPSVTRDHTDASAGSEAA